LAEARWYDRPVAGSVAHSVCRAMHGGDLSACDVTKGQDMTADPLRDLKTGQTIGPYRFDGRPREINVGGLCQVVHTVSGQPRTLKPVHPLQAADPNLMDRIRDEAKALARLQHPHLAQVYGVEESDGVHFVTIEMVTGRSLDVVQRDEGPLPTARALHLLTFVASALDALHANAIVHHDVTPRDVVVDSNDRAKLLDFGCKRALAATALYSTHPIVRPEYMAPELVRGEQSGPGIDQHAFGVVAYELIVGRLPFVGTGLELPRSHYQETPPPPRTLRPDLPEAIEAVLLRQLAKQAAERYPTCSAFTQALSAALAQ